MVNTIVLLLDSNTSNGARLMSEAYQAADNDFSYVCINFSENAKRDNLANARITFSDMKFVDFTSLQNESILNVIEKYCEDGNIILCHADVSLPDGWHQKVTTEMEKDKIGVLGGFGHERYKIKDGVFFLHNNDIQLCNEGEHVNQTDMKSDQFVEAIDGGFFCFKKDLLQEVKTKFRNGIWGLGIVLSAYARKNGLGVLFSPSLNYHHFMHTKTIKNENKEKIIKKNYKDVKREIFPWINDYKIDIKMEQQQIEENTEYDASLPFKPLEGCLPFDFDLPVSMSSSSNTNIITPPAPKILRKGKMFYGYIMIIGWYQNIGCFIPLSVWRGNTKTPLFL